MTQLLDIRSLSVDYGYGAVIRDLSLTVSAGEIVGLVGESGCGKTTLGWSVLGLLPRSARVDGSIMFDGTELIGLQARKRRRLLGVRLSLIPQAAMASLDPMFTVGHQIREIIMTHQRARRSDADATTVGRLREVGVAAPEARLHAFPHELSGGTRQRVATAAAMILNPSMLIADEPTSSLDVTIQAQVLGVLRSIILEQGTAVLFITHDLGVVAQISDRIAVMYAGEIVEEASAEDLFEDPKHPYTKKLLAAHPGFSNKGQRLATIQGSVPDPAQRTGGCRFAPRCPVAIAVCQEERPPWVTLDSGRHVRCVHSAPNH